MVALRESELIAARVLEGLGYRILQTRLKVIIEGVEVSDVDLVAEKDGERFAVEVKAGYADVSSIRQAYVNSVLTDMKPLVVARGFSDESAEVVARRLGVRVVALPDQLYVQPDELFSIIEGAVEEALERVTRPLSRCLDLTDYNLKVLSSLASAPDFVSAASELGMSPEELGRLVESLRSKDVLPRGDFRAMSVSARLLLLCSALRKWTSQP